MQSAFHIKSYKKTLLAFIVQIKNVLKHDWNECNYITYLLSLLCMRQVTTWQLCC